MANKKIKGLTVKIGADTKELGEGLENSKKKSQALQKELSQVQKLLKMDPKNVELVAQKQQILKERVEEAKNKLKLLENAQKEVDELYKKGEIDNGSYRDFQRQIEFARQDVEKFEKQLKTTGDQFAEMQRKSGAVTFKNAEDKVDHFKGKVHDFKEAALKDMQEVSDGFNKAGDKLEKVGGVLNKGSAAAAAVLAGSVASFKDLDDGYDVIVKKTGATDEKFDSLKKTADELFSGSTFDMTDIGNAIGEVNTRFGFTEDKLRSVTEQYLQFAKINDADVSDSVSKTARIMQAWNLSADNLPNLLGMITAKGQETGVAVGGLMDKVLDNNATFKEMGLSLEESISLMAQFEKNGVNDSTALTAMKAAVKNAAEEGKSLSDVLSDNVRDIKNAATDTEALQKATELFGTKGAAEMANAIREGRIDFDNLSGSMGAYKDTVKKTYDATVDPLEESKKVINNLKLAGTELAATALKEGQPLIEDVIDGVKAVTNWLKKLTPEQKKTLTKAIEIMAVVGPGVTVVGKLSKGIGSVVGILPKAATAVKGFGAALSANPVGAWTEAIVLAVTAIAALTAAVNEYSNLKWESTESSKFAAEVDKAADALESSAKKITETTQNTFDSIDESIKNNDLIDTYQSELDELLGKQELTAEEKSKLDLIVKYLTDNVEGFSDAWDKYTIRDEDGNITLVDDLDTVRQALNDTIDEFQKNSYISLMEKSYSDSLSDNLSAITDRDSAKEHIKSLKEQLSKRIKELGLSESDYEELKSVYGREETRIKFNISRDEYDELDRISKSLSNYNGKLLTLNARLKASDELQQDSLDIINVLNGSYDDAAAVLMAFKLNMISLEDVTRNGWSSIEELEKSAAETGKNTVYGVGQDMTDYEEKVYSSTDDMTKDFVDKLSVNKNAAKDTVEGTTKAVDDEAPALRRSMGSAGELARDEFTIPMKEGADSVKDAVSGTTKAIEDETPNLENASEKASEAITNNFDNLDLEEKGGNIILGLLKGLWNNSIFSKIGETVGNVSSAIYNAFTSWWDMHSPAKKSGPLGKNITLGITKEMPKQHSAIKKASAEVNEDIMKSLSETAKSYFQGREYLLEPTFSPLADTRIITNASQQVDTSSLKVAFASLEKSNERLEQKFASIEQKLEDYSKRPIDVYVDGNKLVGGTIGEIDRQLASVEFFKNRGG